MGIIGDVKEQEIYTNSDFINCNVGGWAQRKPWMARIVGEHKKYGLDREFLERVGRVGGYNEFDLSKEIGNVIEINGGSTKHNTRLYIKIRKDGKIESLFETCDGLSAEKKKILISMISSEKTRG